jgi:hypothetical protein
MHPPKTLAVLFLVTLFCTVALPVGAVPFTATPPDTPGPLNGGSVPYTIISPGASSSPGNATLTFDLVGFLTVDGSNCCTDTFTLTINGNPLFSGGFNMGGGGTNFINFIDPGVTIVSTTSNGFQLGGLTQFSVDHALVAGANSYLFDYGAMQGLGDEGWGLRNLRVTADVNVSSVPEPGSLALFCTALLGIGLSAYRRQLATTVSGQSETLSPTPV